jgi:hypothetical protein
MGHIWIAIIILYNTITMYVTVSSNKNDQKIVELLVDAASEILGLPD